MKNKFEKQFNKEFNQTFTPNIDKEFLKEQLSIQPSSNTTTDVVFKKKVFVPLNIVCTLLLIVLTSLTTWGVSKWVAYNNETPPVVDEEVDVVKMFQEKYQNCYIELINKCNIKNEIEISMIKINDNNNSLLIIYFDKIYYDIIEYITYEVNINGLFQTGKISSQGEYIELYFEYTREIPINFALFIENENIF